MNDFTSPKKRFFGQGRYINESSAPARLDILGGGAEYGGCLALQIPTDRRVKVSVAKRTDGILQIQADLPLSPMYLRVPISSLLDSKGNVHYPKIKASLKSAAGTDTWSQLVGCVMVMIKEKQIPSFGMDIWVEIEGGSGDMHSMDAPAMVATLIAIAKTFGAELKVFEAPRLAMIAKTYIAKEAESAGNVLTAYLGEAFKVLPILCQPGQVYPTLEVPDDLHFVGIHVDASPDEKPERPLHVRTAASMGYTMIARHLETAFRDMKEALINGDMEEMPYKGYLANIPPQEFTYRFRRLLPTCMSGGDFLLRFGVVLDKGAELHPLKVYPIAAATSHVIFENARASRFMYLLRNLSSNPQSQEALEEMGKLMYASHKSLAACGLVSNLAGELVAHVMELGTDKGIMGARLTNAGESRIVCLLAKGDEGLKTAHWLSKKYGLSDPQQVSMTIGSSPGTLFS
ncbi:hypothetical protein [Pontibacter sp. G13]|uniref:hypothetical protein n=1 Tax=Pontibacter sp. G13 TaxID=3074898 RepID=UPI00288A8F7D|nr:hypothetical protein [Pontibacter sp. G13]WNJ20138.1 hypothetical protein RJD25_06610 [Pontibacter sp. G13]